MELNLEFLAEVNGLISEMIKDKTILQQEDKLRHLSTLVSISSQLSQIQMYNKQIDLADQIRNVAKNVDVSNLNIKDVITSVLGRRK